jgi:hypothetical protein
MLGWKSSSPIPHDGLVFDLKNKSIQRFNLSFMKTHFLAVVALLAAPLAILGCTGAKAPEPVTKATISKTTSVESKVELTNPTVRFEAPDIIHFEFDYEFTEGSPLKYYLCEIHFPGTEHHGKKYMEPWEMKKKGKIKSGIQLTSLEPMVGEFEIKLSDATQPDAGFKKISNVVSGKVLIPTAETAAAGESK